MRCDHHLREASARKASSVGLGLAKLVFQAQGADASGEVVFRKKLRRDQVLIFSASQPRRVVAMEAYLGASTGSDHPICSTPCQPPQLTSIRWS